MAYTKTNWVNNAAPPISAENLNKIEQELYTLDVDVTEITARMTAAENTLASKADSADIEFLSENKAPMIESTMSGAIVSFDDGANLPVSELLIGIDAVQSGSGDPSPTNIRPISGWEKTNVYRTGKNVVSPLVYNGGSYNPSIGATLNLTVAGDSKQFTANADRTVFTVSTTSNNQTFTILYPIKYGYPVYNNISLSGTSQLRTSRLHLDKDFKVLSRVNNTSKTQSVLGVMTPSENDAYYAIVITNSTATSETITMTNPMACLGNTEAPYEPYVGDVYPISWQTEAGTVYGGTLDVTTGVLTIDKICVDMGTLNWTKWTDYFMVSLSGRKTGSFNNFITSIYPVNSIAGVANLHDKEMVGGVNDTNVYAKDTSFVDATSFKTSVTGQQMVYELATPQTYQLTSVEVQTLLGVNNIFADCGDIKNVTYKADTKLYVDNTIVDVPLAMIAPMETGTTASKAYAVGEYFILNGNQFCKAKTAIASGATFTLNTNYTVTTIGAELKALQ